MKRIICSISAAILATSLLVSCQRTGEAVLSFGDSVITENQFAYYLATYKANYLTSYADMEDTKAFYSLELPNGMTGEEYLFSETVGNVAKSLVCAELFEENGLVLSSSVTDAVDSYIESFIDDYAGGDKRALNSALSEYGINVEMLREIYLIEEKGSALYDYLYGENGTIGVTEAELSAYCDENYARVRHIYINNKYGYEMTEDGYTARDENGNYVTYALSGEELDAKNAVVSAIDEALAAGEDFHAVYEAYSEDKYYENGYYLSPQMDFVEEVELSAFDLEVGEWTKVESDVGVHYIMRLENEERPWENEANADFFDGFREQVSFLAFVEYVEAYIPEVVQNEEKLAEFSVEASPANYRF
ncbi:MAG: hypothetical protein E7638_06880 [Ruminococcaceae bacterium]|nr:hypothetical protein [Oscillospiraceae bacterium]